MPVNAGPNVNTSQRNLSPSLTSDYQKLYFVSYWAGHGEYDIYVSERTGPDWDDWGPMVNLGSPVNTPGYEFTAVIGRDDSTLYYSSDLAFGVAEMRIGQASLQPDGTWGDVHRLGAHLDDWHRTAHPCVTADKSLLVFDQWRYTSTGLDIFCAYWADTGWGERQECDTVISSSYWDGGPSVTASGDTLFFESRRSPNWPQDGDADIWMAVRVGATDPPRQPSEFFQEKLEVWPTVGTVGLPVTIRAKGKPNGPLQIYNILGQRVAVVWPQAPRGNIYFWNAKSMEGMPLSAGSYFIQVLGENQPLFGRVWLLH
jgi:hypothetical protein